jgi:hypothetical protein
MHAPRPARAGCFPTTASRFGIPFLLNHDGTCQRSARQRYFRRAPAGFQIEFMGGPVVPGQSRDSVLDSLG